jgi:folate-binding protein YgfZ
VTGPDWRSFLHNLLTQDVETLADGELRFGALLTPQGRLLYDLFILGEDDGATLDVAADKREALIVRLSMYRLRAKVEIAADERPVSVLFSAHAREGGDPGVLSARAGGSGEKSWVPAFAGMSGFYQDPRLPALGLRGYGAPVPAGATEADEAALDAHRLSLGVPGPADWGEEATYPIEANFDLLHGIDFRKGCFIGQETTSRMKRRGQIRNRMLPIIFDGAPPAPGSEILAGDLRGGEVLSAGDGRAMATVRLDRIEGADLTVEERPVRIERPDWFAA